MGVTSYKIHVSHPHTNLYELTAKSLQSVLSQNTKYSFEVILVDYGTEENTLKKLQAEVKGFEIIRDVFSISKAFNVIFREGFEKRNTRYILAMSNDVILEPRAIQSAMDYASMAHERIALIGAHDTDIFACFLMSREMYLRVGPFDENLIYYPDWDYEERLRELGLGMCSCDLFKVDHVKSWHRTSKGGHTLGVFFFTDKVEELQRRSWEYFKKKYPEKHKKRRVGWQ